MDHTLGNSAIIHSNNIHANEKEFSLNGIYDERAILRKIDGGKS